MTSEYKYVLRGVPIAWARAGLCKGKFYDKQKHDKLVLGIEIERQHGAAPLLKGPLVYRATYYFKIPKSHYKKQEQMMGTPMIYVPDRDNLDKFIADLCKSIVYDDDRTIWFAESKKVWWDEDKTEFSFSTTI